MAKEIERKFLVKNDTWKKSTLLKKINIKQTYLFKDKIKVIRVRLTDDEAFITIKTAKGGIVRDEYEYAIPKADGEQIAKLSTNPVISKTRYYLYDETHQLWEIDVFKGINRGLVVAEIELQDPRQPVMVPKWIGKEVSKDKRYSNANLGEHKVPRR